MSLNENSSREQILKYLEDHSYFFLYHLLDKPWAQSYLDEAAKIAAKDHPTYFLNYFSDKPWAKPYLDEAARGAAKKIQNTT